MKHFNLLKFKYFNYKLKMATDALAVKKFKHFSTLKNELETKKCPDDKTKNLYDHMSKVMDHIILHCPNEALNKLEEISFLIKNNDNYGIQNFLEINKVQLYNQPGEATIKAATGEYIKDAKFFFEVSLHLILYLFFFILKGKAPAEGEEGAEDAEPEAAADEEILKVGFVPDLMADS